MIERPDAGEIGRCHAASLRRSVVVIQRASGIHHNGAVGAELKYTRRGRRDREQCARTAHAVNRDYSHCEARSGFVRQLPVDLSRRYRHQGKRDTVHRNRNTRQSSGQRNSGPNHYFRPKAASVNADQGAWRDNRGAGGRMHDSVEDNHGRGGPGGNARNLEVGIRDIKENVPIRLNLDPGISGGSRRNRNSNRRRAVVGNSRGHDHGKCLSAID